MDKIKDRIQVFLTPREHTDLQSEILNIVAGPIYVYTITTVFYYSLLYVMPYHYSNQGHQGQTEIDSGSGVENENTTLFLHRCLLAMIYFQMMSNWLCIRLVDNSLQTNSYESLKKTYNAPKMESTSAVISMDTNGNNTSQRSTSTNQNQIIPNPASSPPTQTQKISYWSWKNCRKCFLNAPPRCHHCIMCGTCVLKRDHHCFFTGRCVGFFNQRHFIVFLVWASFGTTYSTLHFMPYLFRVVIPNMTSAIEIFPPFALIWWLTGNGSFQTTNMLFSFLFNMLFIFLSSGFIMDQYTLVSTGTTQFERKSLNKTAPSSGQS